jgi:hypothetical protein
MGESPRRGSLGAQDPGRARTRRGAALVGEEGPRSADRSDASRHRRNGSLLPNKFGSERALARGPGGGPYRRRTRGLRHGHHSASRTGSGTSRPRAVPPCPRNVCPRPEPPSGPVGFRSRRRVDRAPARFVRSHPRWRRRAPRVRGCAPDGGTGSGVREPGTGCGRRQGGRSGAGALDPQGRWHEVAPTPVRDVDPVGAGDAFDAGYLHARLDGADVPEALLEGARCGAAVAATIGDADGVPRA